MFRRILVLADNYRLTDFLLRYIPNVFPNAEYHVLSVVDFGYEILSVTDYIKETLEESAIEAMLHCASILEESGISARKTILKGNFKAVVDKYIRENKIDLVTAELYIDEVKKKSQFTRHIEGLFKIVPVPIFAMDRPVELRKPRSVSIFYTGTQHSEIAMNLGLMMAKYLEASCLILYFGERRKEEISQHLQWAAKERGVPVQIDTRECTSAQEIVDILGTQDIFVTTRGGRSWGDKLKMVFKRLPLRKIEIETIMYVPVPMLLVGDTMGVVHG